MPNRCQTHDKSAQPKTLNRVRICGGLSLFEAGRRPTATVQFSSETYLEKITLYCTPKHLLRDRQNSSRATTRCRVRAWHGHSAVSVRCFRQFFPAIGWRWRIPHHQRRCLIASSFWRWRRGLLEGHQKSLPGLPAFPPDFL